MTGVPLNIDWQQILLHLLNFTILFGALYILLYKPVRDFMEKRKAHYEQVEDNAMSNLMKTETDRKTYEKKLSELESEIRAEKEKARSDIDKINTRKIQEAEKEAEKIVEDAKASAKREREKIISSAQAEISELVTKATEKIVLEQSASDAFDQFLDAAEAEERLVSERGGSDE